MRLGTKAMAMFELVLDSWKNNVYIFIKDKCLHLAITTCLQVIKQFWEMLNFRQSFVFHVLRVL